MNISRTIKEPRRTGVADFGYTDFAWDTKAAGNLPMARWGFLVALLPLAAADESSLSGRSSLRCCSVNYLTSTSHNRAPHAHVPAAPCGIVRDPCI